MSQQPLFTMRTLDGKDLEDFNDLLRYAFQVTNRELSKTGWEVDEIKVEKAPILEAAYVLGWFHRQKLVSQIVIYPMRVNIFGEIYAMGGITGVATYPEYTKRGLVHSLMKCCLEHMREENQSISFLYPYAIPFYRKMGWEIVSDKMTFSLRDTQLPKMLDVPDHVERVNLGHEDLKKVHDRFAKERHGALIRDELAWNEYWRWDVDDMVTAIYYNEAREPEGYVVYYLEKEIFNIKEMVALNNQARMELWNYISAHFSMVTEVRGANYTGEPLAFLFDDSDIKETICPYIMARIVDFQQFIEQYPFARQDESLDLRFRIEDDMAPWNHGTFIVKASRGKIVCEKSADLRDGHTVEANIQTLTTMLMGYKRPSYLLRNNRLQASRETVRLLERVIPMEKPYFSDFF